MSRVIWLTMLLAVHGLTGCADNADKVVANGDDFPIQISSEYHDVTLEKVAGGLEEPWALAFLPGGGYLVTERPGGLLLLQQGERTRISGVPDVVARNQGGLLDLVLHPDYQDNGWLYFTWSMGDEQATSTVLSRARLKDQRLVDHELLFEQDRRSEPGRHYGSRIVFLEDGSLLMSIGDRGAEPGRAQDLDDHAGKLIRLAEDGSVPDDNPLLDVSMAQPEIWSWGHRNIQGMVVDPGNGAVWVTEHGPRGGDELNLIEAGNNYGWPEVGKGRDYRTEEIFGEARSREGTIDPVYEFLPTLAPSGLALLTTERFSAWQGNLIAGGLRGEGVRRVVLEDGVVVHVEALLRDELGRIRDVREGPDGHLYLLTDGSDGGLYRLTP